MRNSPGECFVVILSAAKDLQVWCDTGRKLQILRCAQDDRKGIIRIP
jgi:hypothetical protein